VANVTPHPPGDPQKQQSSDQDQPDHLQQLGDDQGEENTEHQSCDYADDDHHPSLMRREAGSERSDHDRIVAGQHQVDHQHLEESGERRGFGDIREVVDDRVPHAGQ
jgi:hypothetical protein